MGCHTSYGGVRGIMKYITNSTTLKKFNDEPEQSHKWILVVPAHLLADPVMINMLSSKTLSTISGILVLDGSRPSLPFSPAQKNPGSLEDKETEFYWNPKANGLLHKAIPVPLWRLDGEDAETILNMALYNANATDYPYFEAEITTFMQPDSTENSALCIRRETCRPIGGHSVYTPLVPLEITDVGDKNKMTKKEIIFLLSVLDSTSLFQKKTIGANGDMSGTIALLGALDALLDKGLTPPSSWKRYVVFAWMDSESFGHAGSKRFFRDILNFSCDQVFGEFPYFSCSSPVSPSLNFKNITLDRIHSLIEPKQVGGFGKELFIHQDKKNSAQSEASRVMEEIGKKMSGSVKLKRAGDPRTPSVPPGVLTSVFEIAPELASRGIVLADHEAEYKNQYYHSIFDTVENIDPELICTTSTLIARTVSLLARGVVDVEKDKEVEKVEANCSLVNQLINCIIKDMSCPLVRALLGKANGLPQHYPSVFQDSSQSFVYHWLYDRLGTPEGNTTCNPGDCPTHHLCYNGTCKQALVFSHQALNENLYVEQGAFSSHWVLNSTQSHDQDNIWTESNWNPLGLRTYKVSNPSIDYVFTFLAVLEIVVGIVFCFFVRKYFPQKFKIL
eukprot:TRINITY_DN5948_c0_g2_i4.p1 TRINITY_DN5948_c0_g2~~TRINITY_DN5948_c0_g2_i4.p1  ORF type:complete len:617 (+),score=133.28 TRINITY_DN5948_c0_g2_i4:242-2092(+)